jgi:hypothetical protein
VSAIRLAVALLIVLVWFVSFVAQMLNPDIRPPAALGGLALLAGAYILGTEIIGDRLNRREDEDG